MTPEQQKDNEEAQILLLMLLMRNFGPTMATSVQTVAENPIVYLGGVSDELLNQMVDAHAHAWYLGRMRAGDLTPFNSLDVQMGRSLAFGQIPYLGDFLAKTGRGGYLNEDGTVNVAAIARRSELYGSRLFGTANQSWASSFPADTVFIWRKTASESCTQCIAYNGNRYTLATLPGFPGDGHTDCGTKCRCYLETERGTTSFIFED